MGVLRLSLALLVVYAHCRSPFGGVGVGAENAVQIFFMISGFYMALVLCEKYAVPGGPGLRAFYANRALRLLPVYLVVAGLTLFLCLLGARLLGWEMPPAQHLRAWREAGLLGWPEMLWLGVSQLGMAGLETFNFVGLSAQGLLPAGSPGADAYPAWRLLLVPQAWSLSLELYFYLLAPWIVTRGLRVIALVAVASFALRLLLWQGFGLYADPWSYRFFPTELMFFMLGAAAYHAFKKRGGAATAQGRRPMRGTPALPYALLAVMGAASVWIGRSGQAASPGQVIAPLLTMAAFLALPWLFEATRRNRADRTLGELSYPVYVVHFLFIWIVGQGGYPAGGGQFLLVLLLTLLAACALYRWVDLPVERRRHAGSWPAPPVPAVQADPAGVRERDPGVHKPARPPRFWRTDWRAAWRQP